MTLFPASGRIAQRQEWFSSSPQNASCIAVLAKFSGYPYNPAPDSFCLATVTMEVQSMIRFQIFEQPGVNLHKTLVDAMRAGELRTFEATKRGRRIQHKNVLYPGWMNWSAHDGMINCEVISPRKPGREWQFFSAFLGRLADRYADQIVGINIQFPAGRSESGKTTLKKRQRTRRRK